MKKNILFFVLLFSFAFSVNAEEAEKQTGIKVPTELPLSSDSVTATIAKVVTFILGLVGALAVLMIIVGGVMYVVGGSDRGTQETAQNIIKWAVVGLVIALLGWVIVNTVVSVLGKKENKSVPKPIEAPTNTYSV